jgi:hypothetical protein
MLMFGNFFFFFFERVRANFIFIFLGEEISKLDELFYFFRIFLITIIIIMGDFLGIFWGIFGNTYN